MSAQHAPPSIQQGELPACGNKPNCVSSAATADSDHYVAPISNPDASLQSISAAIESLGGTVLPTKDDALRATFSSSAFGFIDDLVVLPAAAAGTFQVYSSSRVGYSDMGANRNRVEQLRETLNER